MGTLASANLQCFLFEIRYLYERNQFLRSLGKNHQTGFSQIIRTQQSETLSQEAAFNAVDTKSHYIILALKILLTV